MTQSILDLDVLLDYTDWDRGQWQAFFQAQGKAALAIGLGPHSDGKIRNVGELVRHIFSAELRYVERCQGLPLTDTSMKPADDVEALFAFGKETRAALRKLLATFPAARWDVAQEVTILQKTRRLTPRKMIAQAVTHEMRHWAQIATLVRLEGRKSGLHDLLFSPVLETGAGG